MPLVRQIQALLLDRDGTLIKDKHYLADPDGVELLPGVADSLSLLTRKGIRFFLVSNQSGIGRGLFPLEAAYAVNERLVSLLAPYGVVFSDMIFCPHTPGDSCSCRKPATGMWTVLQKRHGLSPEHCVMVGDKEEDMRFAAHAGLGLRILMLTGKGESTAQKLGLSLYSSRYMELFAEPASPAHPHLLLPTFAKLPLGLELATGNGACNA